MHTSKKDVQAARLNMTCPIVLYSRPLHKHLIHAAERGAMVLTGNGNGGVQEGRVQGSAKDVRSARGQVRVQVYDGHAPYRPAGGGQNKEGVNERSMSESGAVKHRTHKNRQPASRRGS